MMISAENRNQRAESREQSFWLPFVTALLIRLIVVAFNFRATPDAALHYERFGWEMGWIARSLAQGHGYSSPFFPISGPTAMMPPLYPSLIAAVFRIFGVYSTASAFTILALNSLFSSLICITLFFIAKHSFGRRIAYICSWAWALHPFAIYFSANRVWDYALTGLLLSVCFCVAQRLGPRHRWEAWFGFGLLYGLVALSNPATLSMLPILLLLALYNGHDALGSQWVQRGLIAFAGVLVIILPWSLRCERTMHIFCPVRDNFWLECWSGNTGDTSDPMPAWTHPASNPAEMEKYLASGEVQYIAQKRTMAIETLRRHPVFFVELSIRRAVYFWTGFWSLSPDYRHREPFEIPNVFFCTALTLLMLAGLFRLLRRNRILALPYAGIVMIFPMIYYLTHPLMDYRQPIEPEIVILIVMAMTSKAAWAASLDTERRGSEAFQTV